LQSFLSDDVGVDEDFLGPLRELVVIDFEAVWHVALIGHNGLFPEFTLWGLRADSFTMSLHVRSSGSFLDLKVVRPFHLTKAAFL